MSFADIEAVVGAEGAPPEPALHRLTIKCQQGKIEKTNTTSSTINRKRKRNVNVEKDNNAIVEGGKKVHVEGGQKAQVEGGKEGIVEGGKKVIVECGKKVRKAGGKVQVDCHFKTQYGNSFYQILAHDKTALVQLTLKAIAEPAAYAASEVLLTSAAKACTRPGSGI